MVFQFQGKEYRYPASLSEITIRERIAFQEQYGAALDERLIAIHKLESDLERDLMITEWQMDSAVESFSFFTGIELEDVKDKIQIGQVLKVYYSTLRLLMEQEEEITLQPSYTWKGEKWYIAPPEVTPNSGFTFNEFLTAKEAVRQLMALGKGKWEALPYLCCIYLRKEGEEFKDSFIDPEGERMQMMMDLPLDIALHVGFFLASTATIYSSTSQFSEQEKEEAKDPT